MADPARVVCLELWQAGDSPAGRAIAAGRSPRAFAGWLGLIAALDALIVDDDRCGGGPVARLGDAAGEES